MTDSPNVIPLTPRQTYTARGYEVPYEAASFKISGTLDGFIDFATPSAGTYALTLDEARGIIAALSGAVSDVTANCLYDNDALRIK